MVAPGDGLRAKRRGRRDSRGPDGRQHRVGDARAVGRAAGHVLPVGTGRGGCPQHFALVGTDHPLPECPTARMRRGQLWAERRVRGLAGSCSTTERNGPERERRRCPATPPTSSDPELLEPSRSRGLSSEITKHHCYGDKC